ncbi:hypothetical protein [Nostoc sp.]|uniref:hypothetical protein n=1 Tax=Nostoc sp. TaxID=1180 RepID=UPI002FF70986
MMIFKRFRTWGFLIGLALLTFVFVGCASGNQTASQALEKITIAYLRSLFYP